ncbi:tyrosine-type recombinase/integrase [Deinococcus pimensis]|uniref:tyrosine-type recombinase/integrase n=1 Tax=Deinococcus pimensis TaxID=309888 RepID=UPI000486701B|nr:site-specific integrase [Deinococcus pimensis]
MTAQRKPRRPNGAGSEPRKLNSGHYNWRFTAGWDSNNKQISISGTERTKRDAYHAMAIAMADFQRGHLATPKALTLEPWIRHWLTTAQPRLAPKTHANYTHLAQRHLYPSLGCTRLQALKPSDIRVFYATLVEQGYSRSVLRQLRALLRGSLRDALLDEIIPRNVADLVPLPVAKAEREGRALTPVETRTFLAQAHTHRLGVLFEVSVTTGLRRGEICALRWEFVDLDRGVLKVRENLPVIGGRATLGSPKTNASLRDVPLASETVALLKQHRAQQDQEYLDGGWLAPPEYVFTRPDGTRLNPEYITRLTRRIAKAAGLGKVRLHDLRHTNTSLLLRGGVPVEVVSRQLGHARVGFTLDRYRHVYEDEHHTHAKGLTELLTAPSQTH